MRGVPAGVCVKNKQLQVCVCEVCLQLCVCVKNKLLQVCVCEVCLQVCVCV